MADTTTEFAGIGMSFTLDSRRALSRTLAVALIDAVRYANAFVMVAEADGRGGIGQATLIRDPRLFIDDVTGEALIRGIAHDGTFFRLTTRVPVFTVRVDYDWTTPT